MIPIAILRLAPYAIILGLALALWSSINLAQREKTMRLGVEIERAALSARIEAATAAATTIKEHREHAIASAVTEARDIERQAALVNDARLRAAAAAERSDAGRLREQLADALRLACVAAQDPAAAGDGPAATLGDVLAEALRVQAEATSAAERHAGEVRALQRAWPTQ